MCSAMLPTIGTRMTPTKSSEIPYSSVRGSMAPRRPRRRTRRPPWTEQHHERGHPPERRVPLSGGDAALGASQVEEQVQDVEDEHHNRDLDAEGRGSLAGARGGEDRGEGERGGDDGEHRGVYAGDARREALGAVLEPAEEQARSEHQQDVTDNGADDRGLHHRREARGESEYGDDELGGVPECGVEHAPMRGLEWCPRDSVACPSTQASAMRARAETTKIRSVGTCKSSTTTTPTVSATVAP